MAVGDQIHWIGYSGADLRPSSGVEVVIKTLTGGFSSTSNYFYYYHRTASYNYSSAIVAGSSVDSYSKSPGGNYVGAGGGVEGHRQVNLSVPINYANYMYAAEQGSSNFAVSGYITKE